MSSDHQSHDTTLDHHTSDGTADASSTLGFTDDFKNLLQADQLFFAELDPLNNSGAEGAAFLALNGTKLTVITAATGVEPGQVHPQHIHGFEDGDESNVPTLRQDDDTDGFVELTEGEESYGPVLLDLTSPPNSGLPGFPTPSGSSFVFIETYDLSDPASGSLANLLLEVPLEDREIVLHGITLAEGQGETNALSSLPNEADGTAGYKAVLPIVAGEIQVFSPEDGLLSVLTAFAFGQSNELLA